MGAEQFENVVKAKSMDEAFALAVNEALYMFGHGGYTGSIAEKSGFVKIDIPRGVEPELYAHALISGYGEAPSGVLSKKFAKDMEIVNDKWGPAAAIDMRDGTFYFFGCASS